MAKTTRLTLLFGAVLVLQAGCAMTKSPEGPVQNSGVPGDTGRTRVIGSNSTVAGDAQATYQQQKWPLQPPR